MASTPSKPFIFSFQAAPSSNTVSPTSAQPQPYTFQAAAASPNTASSTSAQPQPSTSVAAPSKAMVKPTTYEEERTSLLAFHDATDSSTRSGPLEELRTSPLFSLQVKHNYQLSQSAKTEDAPKVKEHTVPAINQYSFLGVHVGDHDSILANEPILHNTRAPFSTFICGSQGSGKSYTLSCMLENCLKPDPKLGQVGPQQAGLVLHYDLGSQGLPSETAGLCRLGVPVQVLVSPTNFSKLSCKYREIAEAGNNLTVTPLYLRDTHLTIANMMKLMAFNDGNGHVPLYMGVVQQILRQIAIENKGFDYNAFRAKVDKQRFSRDQDGPLALRFNMLDSFMDQNNRKGLKKRTADAFDTMLPGTLTIIDLSCPFVDAATARVLFDICLGIAKDHQPDSGLVVALDEAHKFIDDSEGASGLTEHLLTTVREQRHNAVRVIIATQEPTISTKLLDLCSVSIIHRFSSPAWYNAIANHLAGPKHADTELLDEIVKLGIGKSLVFAPSAYVCSIDGQITKLAGSYFKMKTRQRQGKDLGMSQLADRIV